MIDLRYSKVAKDQLLVLVPNSRPGRFPGIAGNAGNHGNDGKLRESHKILNQI